MILFTKAIVVVASEAEGYLLSAVVLIDPLADALTVAHIVPPLVVAVIVAIPRGRDAVSHSNNLHLAKQQVWLHFGRLL